VRVVTGSISTNGKFFFHSEGFFNFLLLFSNSPNFFNLFERFPRFFEDFSLKKKNLQPRHIENLANSNFGGGSLEFELARFDCI